MTLKYSERADRVVGLAQEQARRRSSASVGTADLLLALIREGAGIGVRALRQLGVDLEAAASTVEQGLAQGEVPPGPLPATPRLQKVLTGLALEEARALGHAYVGTEHLLLGLLRDRECPAAQALQAQGADLERVRGEVARLLGAPPARPPLQL